MGKLEDALEDVEGQGGRGSLGEAIGSGGASLQEGRRGATAEEQIEGAGTLPDDAGEHSEEVPAMPTSPGAADDLGETER